MEIDILRIGLIGKRSINLKQKFFITLAERKKFHANI